MTCGYELVCEREARTGAGIPRRLAVGFFMLPLEERDESGDLVDEEAIPPDPEPFGVRLLERVLRGWRIGGPDEPYLEWF